MDQNGSQSKRRQIADGGSVSFLFFFYATKEARNFNFFNFYLFYYVSFSLKFEQSNKYTEGLVAAPDKV